MKFDPKKPYGVITNHAWAKFEQDGVLFDQQGHTYEQKTEPVEQEEVIPVTETPDERDFALEQARDFLKNILSGGAVARSSIFKEATANNQNWEKIKTAFSIMGGEAFQRRNVIHWKLKAE